MENTNEKPESGAIASSELFDVGLSDAERERLALLLEECGEVQQIIGKILRHGYESNNPLIPNHPTNRQLLELEMGHVRAAYFMMTAEGDLDIEKVGVSLLRKQISVGQWLHFQGERGHTSNPNATPPERSASAPCSE